MDRGCGDSEKSGVLVVGYRVIFHTVDDSVANQKRYVTISGFALFPL